MIRDRFPDVIQNNFNFRILAHASDQAKNTLIAKGITPAIFLSPFYSQKHSLDINFSLKDNKYIKPFSQPSVIDFKEFYSYKEDNIHKINQRQLLAQPAKIFKPAHQSCFENREEI